MRRPGLVKATYENDMGQIEEGQGEKRRPQKARRKRPCVTQCIFGGICVIVLLFLGLGRMISEHNRFTDFCYRPDAYPKQGDEIHLINPERGIKLNWNTRVMPSRLGSGGVVKLIESMIQQKMLHSNSTLTIYVDEGEYTCDKDEVEKERKLRWKKADGEEIVDVDDYEIIGAEEERWCVSAHFRPVLSSIKVTSERPLLRVVVLPVEHHKKDLVNIAEKYLSEVDPLIPNAKIRAKESLLNMDFVRTMSHSLEHSLAADLYFWVEDDVTIDRNFDDMLMTGLLHGYQFYSGYSPYHGVKYDYGTCLIGFTRTGLSTFITNVKNTLGYRPLDMVMKLFHQKETIQCVPSCVTHNFDVSSTIRSRPWSTFSVPLFPDREGYPLGYNHLKNPKTLLRWLRVKAWEYYNHIAHHTVFSSGGDWDQIREMNEKTCRGILD